MDSAARDTAELQVTKLRVILINILRQTGLH